MILTDKKFIRFILLFCFTFLFFYFAALYVTGLAVPGGQFSPFVEKYFNVAGWLRTSLIQATKWVVGLFGIQSLRTNEYVLRIPGANGIRIVYSCLGFGVMSFWVAYIIATVAKFSSKIKWLCVGLIIIWIINVVRISMVLLSGNKGWKFPFGWDHHTWFNIVAYLSIFTLMYFFEKEIKKIDIHGS